MSDRLKEIIFQFSRSNKQIFDIAEAFDIDLSQQLDEFAHEVSNIIIKYDEKDSQLINFAETSSVLEISTRLYSKKVDMFRQDLQKRIESFWKQAQAASTIKKTSKSSLSPEELFDSDQGWQPFLQPLNESGLERSSAIDLAPLDAPYEDLRKATVIVDPPVSFLNAEPASLVIASTVPSSGFHINSLPIHQNGMMLLQCTDIYSDAYLDGSSGAGLSSSFQLRLNQQSHSAARANAFASLGTFNDMGFPSDLDDNTTMNDHTTNDDDVTGYNNKNDNTTQYDPTINQDNIDVNSEPLNSLDAFFQEMVADENSELHDATSQTDDKAPKDRAAITDMWALIDDYGLSSLDDPDDASVSVQPTQKSKTTRPLRLLAEPQRPDPVSLLRQDIPSLDYYVARMNPRPVTKDDILTNTILRHSSIGAHLSPKVARVRDAYLVKNCPGYNPIIQTVTNPLLGLDFVNQTQDKKRFLRRLTTQAAAGGAKKSRSIDVPEARIEPDDTTADESSTHTLTGLQKLNNDADNFLSPAKLDGGLTADLKSYMDHATEKQKAEYESEHAAYLHFSLDDDTSNISNHDITATTTPTTTDNNNNIDNDGTTTTFGSTILTVDNTVYFNNTHDNIDGDSPMLPDIDLVDSSIDPLEQIDSEYGHIIGDVPSAPTHHTTSSFDNDEMDAIFNKNSQLIQSYQSECKKHIAQYLALGKHLEPSREGDRILALWERKMETALEQESKHDQFNITDYGNRVIDRCGGEKQSTRPLSEMIAQTEPYQACRLFLATLLLANQSNVEIVQPKVKDWDTFDGSNIKITVLNTNINREAFNDLADLDGSHSSQKSLAVVAHGNIRGKTKDVSIQVPARGSGGARGGRTNAKKASSIDIDDDNDDAPTSRVPKRPRAAANKQPVTKRNKNNNTILSEDDDGFIVSSGSDSSSSSSCSSGESESESDNDIVVRRKPAKKVQR